jgi:hypothetical protein
MAVAFNRYYSVRQVKELTKLLQKGDNIEVEAWDNTHQGVWVVRTWKGVIHAVGDPKYKDIAHVTWDFQTNAQAVYGFPDRVLNKDPGYRYSVIRATRQGVGIALPPPDVHDTNEPAAPITFADSAAALVLPPVQQGQGQQGAQGGQQGAQGGQQGAQGQGQQQGQGQAMDAAAAFVQLMRAVTGKEHHDEDSERHNPIKGATRVNRAVTWSSGRQTVMCAARAVGTWLAPEFRTNLTAWQQSVRQLFGSNWSARDQADTLAVSDTAPVLFNIATGMISHGAPDDEVEQVLVALQAQLNTMIAINIRGECQGPGQAAKGITYFEGEVRKHKGKEARNTKFVVEYDTIFDDTVAKFRSRASYFRQGSAPQRPPRAPQQGAFKQYGGNFAHPPAQAPYKKMPQ